MFVFSSINFMKNRFVDPRPKTKRYRREKKISETSTISCVFVKCAQSRLPPHAIRSDRDPILNLRENDVYMWVCPSEVRVLYVKCNTGTGMIREFWPVSVIDGGFGIRQGVRHVGQN